MLRINGLEVDEESYKENMGFILRISAAFGHRGFAVAASLHHLIHTLLYTKTLFIYISTGEYSHAVDMMYHLTIVFCSIFVIWLIQYNRENVILLFGYTGNGRFRYNDFDTESLQVFERIRTKTSLFKKRVQQFRIASIAFVALYVGNRYNTDVLLGIRVLGEPMEHGVNRNLPIPVWSPLDVNGNWSLYLLTYWMQLFNIMLESAIATGVTGFFCSICLEICAEQEMLNYVVKNVVEISKRRMVTDKSQLSMREALEDTLNQALQHEVFIVRSATILSHMYTLILFFFTGLTTSILSASGAVLTMNVFGWFFKFYSSFLGFITAFDLFIYCFFSDRISEFFQQTGDSIYFSEWTEYSTVIKHYVLLMQRHSQKPVGMSIGGFAVMTYETFAAVIRSAYSILNAFVIFMED